MLDLSSKWFTSLAALAPGRSIVSDPVQFTTFVSLTSKIEGDSFDVVWFDIPILIIFRFIVGYQLQLNLF